MFIQLISLGIVQAVAVDISSEASVTAAMNAMAANLMSYYDPNNTGAVGAPLPKNTTGPDGFQWYEGGIMWGVMMEYIQMTGDKRFTDSVVNGLVRAGNFEVGSFLGKNAGFAAKAGHWNDDIGWWALPVINGIESFGSDTVMPGGVSYSKLAMNTYNQIMEQWSDTCNGGIYWSRDRQGDSNDYKSTITNAQMMYIGGRLAFALNQPELVSNSDKIYKFIKASGILTENYQVNDGLYEKQNCGLRTVKLSYKAGFLAGALTWMFKASGNQLYMDEANKVTMAALALFAKNDIITDPCEEDGSCQQNQVMPKGTMIRGLGYVAQFTNSPDVKAKLQAVLQKTVQSMFNTCDANYKCGGYWARGQPEESNIHYQINALELVVAYLKSVKPESTTASIPPPVAQPLPIPTKSKTGAASGIDFSAEIFVIAVSIMSL